MRIINDCVLEISITGLSFLKHFIIVLIPPLSWLFIVNFQGKQFTASAIFLRCTSARLTILTKDYNNQSRLITVVLPKRVFMVRTASCIHYHLPEKTQRLLCMDLPLPFPAPLQDGLLFLFPSDPTRVCILHPGETARINFERPY